MTDSIDTIIDGVLDREAGKVNNPHDPGGPTNRGITLRTLSEELGREATIEELWAMSEDTARRIYRKKYVERPGFLHIADPLLREFLVDCEVNHRPGVGVKFLQRALGLTVDGVLGPLTAAAAGRANAAEVYREVVAQRVAFYGRIITDDPEQDADVFAAGWGNRVAGFVRRIPVAA